MAAGSTYTSIATTTLGSAAASYTFSSISGSYTDLILVTSAATTHTSATFLYMQFNGDTATNYSSTELFGDGTSAASYRGSNLATGWIGPDISISNTVGDSNSISNIMNYSNSTTYKTFISRTNRGNSSLDYYGTDATVGLWRSTAAITSIVVKNRRGGVDYNFAAGSTFTLYGIAAA
jgi:hypothetical protein